MWTQVGYDESTLGMPTPPRLQNRASLATRSRGCWSGGLVTITTTTKGTIQHRHADYVVHGALIAAERQRRARRGRAVGGKIFVPPYLAVSTKIT